MLQRVWGQVDSGWLLDNITRQVGDGESTMFWIDPWLDGKPLCKVYVRLYELSEIKFASVANCLRMGEVLIGTRGGGVGGCSLGRRIF